MHRVVLIGNAFVGKTALIQKKISSEVPPRYEETIGAAFQSYHETINQKDYLIQVWDTAGQEKYRSLGPVYYRNANAAIVVYDVTDRSTFQAVPEWIQAFRDTAGDKAKLILVGNKVDLESKIVVDESEGAAFAESYNMPFLLTSAITGYNVDHLFQQIASLVVTVETEESTITKKKEKTTAPSKGCC